VPNYLAYVIEHLYSPNGPHEPSRGPQLAAPLVIAGDTPLDLLDLVAGIVPLRQSSLARFSVLAVPKSPSTTIARAPGNTMSGAAGWLCLAPQQVLEIGERPVGSRRLLLSARRHLIIGVRHLLSRVLIVVTVET
jgi:hypothetical protein